VSEKSDIRQAVYPHGFHVIKAYGGVVVKRNVLSTFAQHRLFVSFGTVVSDLDYGFQGQKSVLVKVYNARPITACRPRLVVNLISECCITSLITISVG